MIDANKNTIKHLGALFYKQHALGLSLEPREQALLKQSTFRFKIINNNIYVNYKNLGCGAFGTVSKARRLDILFDAQNINPTTTVNIKADKCVIKKQTDNFGLCTNEFNLIHQSYPNFQGQLVLNKNKLGETTSSIITMPYLGSTTLEKYFVQHAYNIDLDYLQIISIAISVAEDISRFHQKTKSVHNDIKPENIVFNKKDSSWHLIDFGLAVSVGKTTNRCGTPGFMAPEKKIKSARFESAFNTDVYELGITFSALFGFLMLSGTECPTAKKADVFKATRNALSGKIENSGVKKELTELVRKMIPYDREKRIDLTSAIAELFRIKELCELHKIDCNKPINPYELALKPLPAFPILNDSQIHSGSKRKLGPNPAEKENRQVMPKTTRTPSPKMHFLSPLLNYSRLDNANKNSLSEQSSHNDNESIFITP
jgi:serine/threonine protein kinase